MTTTVIRPAGIEIGDIHLGLCCNTTNGKCCDSANVTPGNPINPGIQVPGTPGGGGVAIVP